MAFTGVAIRALKPEPLTLGRHPALSLRQARLERDRREALVVQGQSPAAQNRLTRQRLGPEVPVAEFGERFFREIVSRHR
jgi:hypothetical protein